MNHWWNGQLVWKLATAFAVAVAFVAITRNTTNIQQVCSTVQRQLDRNEESVRKQVENLLTIQAAPAWSVRQNLPGAGYYSTHPKELQRALNNAEDELATYQVDAC